MGAIIIKKPFTIAISSDKGGIGKSTISVNLATMLGKQYLPSSKILLSEENFVNPNVLRRADMDLGIYGPSENGLPEEKDLFIKYFNTKGIVHWGNKRLKEETPLEDYIIPSTHISNLAYSVHNKIPVFKKEQFHKFKNKWIKAQDLDVIVRDLSNGTHELVYDNWLDADVPVLVASMDFAAMQDAANFYNSAIKRFNKKSRILEEELSLSKNEFDKLKHAIDALGLNNYVHSEVSKELSVKDWNVLNQKITKQTPIILGLNKVRDDWFTTEKQSAYSLINDFIDSLRPSQHRDILPMIFPYDKELSKSSDQGSPYLIFKEKNNTKWNQFKSSLFQSSLKPHPFRNLAEYVSSKYAKTRRDE